MTPRAYQSLAIEKTEEAFREFTKVLGVAATGAGKTIIFSLFTERHLAERAENRVLIIAHREELLSQAADKLHRSTGIPCEIERAESRASLDARVVVASIQTLARRFDRFPSDHFSRIIVDEAHHALADSYQPTLGYFHNRGARVLGVTATPGTKGKKALGNYFETISFEIGLIDLIHDGYLSPITLKSFPLVPDRSAAAPDFKLDVARGDYDQEEVAAALDPYLENVVSRLGAEIGTRKTIVFLPLVKTVERFVALCNAAGLTAAGVHGESEDRASILSAHGRDFQILANSMLLTEGYDDPEIQAMMILRPTRSEILFAQMVGRGTRIFCPHGCTQRCGHLNRKRSLLLLDPLWLHDDMQLVRPARLVTGRDDDRQTITERISEAQGELDLLDLLADAEHEREKSLAEKLQKMERRQSTTISVEEWAVISHNPNIADFEPTMGWHSAPASPKQLDFIQKVMGMDPASVKSRGHASALMNSFFERSKKKLATPRQVRLLTKMKHPAPLEITVKDACTWLDEKMGKSKKKENPTP